MAVSRMFFVVSAVALGLLLAVSSARPHVQMPVRPVVHKHNLVPCVRPGSIGL